MKGSGESVIMEMLNLDPSQNQKSTKQVPRVILFSVKLQHFTAALIIDLT
jgi:hypothetical protein